MRMKNNNYWKFITNSRYFYITKYGYAILLNDNFIIINKRWKLLKILWTHKELRIHKISFAKGYIWYKTDNEICIKDDFKYYCSKLDYKIFKIFLTLFTPKIYNYFKYKIRFIIYDYAYKDASVDLNNYSIINTKISHENEKIKIEFPISDAILGVWIAKLKLEECEDAQLYWNDNDISKIDNFSILILISTNEDIKFEIRGKNLKNEKNIIVYPILSNKPDKYYLDKIIPHARYKM